MEPWPAPAAHPFRPHTWKPQVCPNQLPQPLKHSLEHSPPKPGCSRQAQGEKSSLGPSMAQLAALQGPHIFPRGFSQPPALCGYSCSAHMHSQPTQSSTDLSESHSCSVSPFLVAALAVSVPHTHRGHGHIF